MGTNYYMSRPSVFEEIHIGKRSIGKGGVWRFIWAIEPHRFYEYLLRYVTSDGQAGNCRIVGDVEMNMIDFYFDVIGSCVEHDYTLIGEEFS